MEQSPRHGRLRLAALLLMGGVIGNLTGCGAGSDQLVSRTSGSNSGPSSTVTVGHGSSTPSSQPAPQTLNVKASPANGGTIVSNPAGINCGSTCSAAFVTGTAVALTVNPGNGFAFTGWSGACSGTGACKVTLNSDQSVTANFGPPPAAPVTLNIQKAGSGSGSVTSSPAGISCGATCSAGFTPGTTVTLSAAPVAGSSFTGWSGASCAGTGVCTFTVSANTSVTATFTPLATLTISHAGAGSGSVSSFPAGISCGSTCSAQFSTGTIVSVAATPAAGSVFTGWGGACSGTGGCTLTLTSSQAVTANFGPAPPPAQQTLSISKIGAGGGTVTSSPAGISCGSTCSAGFSSGTSVTLTALASAGSVFAGWSGSACVGIATCTLLMNSPTAVTAVFLPQVTVSVSRAGTGSGTVTSSPAGINCGSTCSATFTSGTQVSLAASPAPGSIFTGWLGACTGTATCTLTPTSNQSVTATFAPAPLPQFALNVSLLGPGTGTVISSPTGVNCGLACSANFTSGTVVTLTASPAPGSAFVGWSSATCSGQGACTTTMNSPQTVTAQFATIQPLFVTVNGSGTVTSSPAGISCPTICAANFNQGTSVTLSASPANGYLFSGWSGACSGTGNCTVVMNGSVALNAAFSPSRTSAAPVLTLSPSPFDFGTVQTNTTGTRTVQITNTGPSSAGNLVVSAAGSDNGAFSVPSFQFPLTVPAGSSLPLTIAFSPQANGTYNGTLSFTSNASNNPTLSVTATASSTVSSSGALSVTPTDLFFGNVPIGTTATQTVQMSNPGSSTTLVSASTVSGSGFTVVTPTFPLLLAAGATQTVQIAFTPQAAGSVTGVITFTSNAAGSNPVVSLIATGNGSSPTTSVTVSPGDISFGAIVLGSSATQKTTLFNTGNTPVIVQSATLSGNGYTVDTSALPVTIPVNGSQAILITFTPAGAGSATGKLTFTTNAPGNQPSVNLSGTGAPVSGHVAVLSWTASTGAVAGYNVYRSTVSGFGYQKVNPTLVTQTTFTDSSLASGQTYYWVVTAVNGVESAYSNQVSATVPVP